MEIHWWLAGISTMWTRATKAGVAGKLHCRRGIETIKEHGGILDLLGFIQDCLEDFPDRVQAAKHSEEEAVEMEESRLDMHQALQKAESLLREVAQRVDKTPPKRSQTAIGRGIA